MARARNIKPGLFKNEILGVADPLLTILFQSLWCLADREGRLEDRPLRIKAETFPYREGLDVNGYLTELARLGFISRYSVSGCSYIQVLNFAKHQNPHNTEKKSEIPEMSEESASCALTVSTPLNNGTSRADSLNLIPDSPILIPDPLPASVTPAEKISARKSSPEVQEVFDYWQQQRGHERAKLDEKRQKAIKARLKDGYTVGDLCRAVDGISKSSYHMGQNDSRMVYDDIELICRTATNVDKFAKLAEPQQFTDPGLQHQVDILQQWMDKNDD